MEGASVEMLMFMVKLNALIMLNLLLLTRFALGN